MQFVLRYTKGGGSSTESLINPLKSKRRIHVTHASEDHKTIPAQEEILSQIVEKEMSLFEATKKRSNNLEKLFHALITIMPKSVEPEGFFQPLVYLSQNSETDWMIESVLWLSCASITNISDKLCFT